MADEPLMIDEFQLINPIASGSFTTVWEVAEKGGGAKHYAMKLLLPEALQDGEQKSVLKHEAKIAEKLQHPNFVHFYKFVSTKKQCYLVMDYFRAPNLKSALNSDPIAVQVRFLRLAEQMCQVLAFMHDQGYLHRDIKPDNILFNRSSEVRLIDFSLSTRISGAMAKMLTTKRGKLIQGTRTYIAPETIKKEVPTQQTDMYSLGVTWFEALTGEPPFKGSSPDELLKKHVGHTPPEPSLINRNITPEMDKLIMRMLAKKPKDRHGSMHEVFSELRALRVYKEDMQELATKMQKEDDAKKTTSLDKAGRLDSRADAFRQQLSVTNPELARQMKEERDKLHADQKRRDQEQAERARRFAGKSESPPTPAASTPKPAAPAPQVPPTAYPQPGFPQPGGMPYGQPMPYPGQGYPGMPYGAPQYGAPMPPGYGVPQYGAPPQYGMPPQYGAPGYPQPGYPQQPYGSPYGMPQPPVPGGQQPPRPAAPIPTPPQQPVAGAPQSAVPPRPQPAAPQPPRPAAPPAPGAPGAATTYWQELPPLDNAKQQAQPPKPQPPRAPVPQRPADPNLPLMDQLPPVE
ncbi:MAG: serine/threonine protein kinase [Planctomycetaceae bacterium]